MKFTAPMIAIAATAILVACSDNTSNQNTSADETAAKETSTTMDKARETATKVAEKAQEVAEKLKLDTSSLSDFKESLNEMKASLNEDQAGQLTSALSSLAKESAGDKQGLVNAAKSLASGRSAEETLYDTMADTLDGMTFDDILKLAGN